MPEIDPNSPYAHLIRLTLEYKETIDLTESGMLETEDIRELLGQRSLLHDSIIAELERLNISFEGREDAMRKAYQIAQWYRDPEA
jgi:hypothetical protein